MDSESVDRRLLDKDCIPKIAKLSTLQLPAPSRCLLITAGYFHSRITRPRNLMAIVSQPTRLSQATATATELQITAYQYKIFICAPRQVHNSGKVVSRS